VVVSSALTATQSPMINLAAAGGPIDSVLVKGTEHAGWNHPSCACLPRTGHLLIPRIIREYAVSEIKICTELLLVSFSMKNEAGGGEPLLL
jgi:hypothetical protein